MFGLHVLDQDLLKALSSWLLLVCVFLTVTQWKKGETTAVIRLSFNRNKLTRRAAEIAQQKQSDYRTSLLRTYITVSLVIPCFLSNAKQNVKVM